MKKSLIWFANTLLSLSVWWCSFWFCWCNLSKKLHFALILTTKSLGYSLILFQVIYSHSSFVVLLCFCWCYCSELLIKHAHDSSWAKFSALSKRFWIIHLHSYKQRKQSSVFFFFFDTQWDPLPHFAHLLCCALHILLFCLASQHCQTVALLI